MSVASSKSANIEHMFCLLLTVMRTLHPAVNALQYCAEKMNVWNVIKTAISWLRSVFIRVEFVFRFERKFGNPKVITA